MTIEREFYSLSALAAVWKCSVDDLIHLGIQDRAQICVNIYGADVDQVRTRQVLEEATLTELKLDEVNPQDLASLERWRSRTTKEMPPGIYEIETDELRFFSTPGASIHELSGALKFQMGSWWDVEFRSPVTVLDSSLCILHEEKLRLDREVFPPGGQLIEMEPKTDLGTRERETLLKIIYAMAVNRYGYDPTQRNDAATVISSATHLVGDGITAETIRDKLKDGAQIVTKKR